MYFSLCSHEHFFLTNILHIKEKKSSLSFTHENKSQHIFSQQQSPPCHLNISQMHFYSILLFMKNTFETFKQKRKHSPELFFTQENVLFFSFGFTHEKKNPWKSVFLLRWLVEKKNDFQVKKKFWRIFFYMWETFLRNILLRWCVGNKTFLVISFFMSEREKNFCFF